MEGSEKASINCLPDGSLAESEVYLDREFLMRLLRTRDSEIVKLKEQLAECQKLLATANSENEKLKNTVLHFSPGDPLSLNGKDGCKNIPECDVKTTPIQVPEEPLWTGDGEKPMPTWNETSNETNTASIADILRETVEGEIHDQGCGETIHADENAPQQYGTACKEGNQTSSEYIYDSNSGFYYHPATGYYWDPTSGLFYDYTSCLYYRYNEKSGAYEIHSNSGSQADVNTHLTKVRRAKSPTRKPKLRRRRNDLLDMTDSRLRRRTRRSDSNKRASSPKKRYINSFPEQSKDESDLVFRSNPGDDDTQSESSTINSLRKNLMDYESDSSGSLASGESELVSDLESGECSSSSGDSDVEIITSPSDRLAQDQEDYSCSEAMAEDYPPCIRFIVQESESLSIGALYVVTCAGGSVGRESSQALALIIPDTSVSKRHANIAYDYDEACYKIEDLGSQNGTMINEQRLSESKKKSSSYNLSHGDTLQLGNTTKLLVHIHKGHETCEDCEPGQVQAKLKAREQPKQVYQVLSKEERKIQQRQELKRIKKKFGLQNSHFENPGASINKSEYSDKAMVRRKLVGSENDVGTQEMPASVHCPIKASNKGHRLLAKMGWKEGEGLGKSSTGIAEPINVELRLNQSAGLGSGASTSLSIDNLQQAGKAKRWNQTRQRFYQLTADENQSPAHVSQTKSTNTQNCKIVDTPNLSESPSDVISSSPASSNQKKENPSTLPHPGVSWVKGETQQPPG